MEIYTEYQLLGTSLNLMLPWLQLVELKPCLIHQTEHFSICRWLQPCATTLSSCWETCEKSQLGVCDINCADDTCLHAWISSTWLCSLSQSNRKESITFLSCIRALDECVFVLATRKDSSEGFNLAAASLKPDFNLLGLNSTSDASEAGMLLAQQQYEKHRVIVSIR